MRLEKVAQGLSNSRVKPLLRTFNALYGVYNVFLKTKLRIIIIVQRTESKDTEIGINSFYLHNYYYHCERHKNIHQNKKAVYFRRNDIVYRITRIHVIRVRE